MKKQKSKEKEIEALVEKVLPKDKSILEHAGVGLGIKIARMKLKSALTSGLLCEPMTVEEIESIMYKMRKEMLDRGGNISSYTHDKDVAQAIHEAQMRRK